MDNPKIIRLTELQTYDTKIKEYISKVIAVTNGIMTIKGKIDDLADFPSDANIGDVYILTTTSTMYVKLDDTGTLLDIGSSTIDLNDVYKKTEVDNLLKNKITFLNALPTASVDYLDICMINSMNGGIYKCVEIQNDDSSKSYLWNCLNYSKDDLDDLLDNKLSYSDLIEGDNITITQNDEGKVIISSTGGETADIDEETLNELKKMSSHTNREVLDELSTDGFDLYYKGVNVTNVKTSDGKYSHPVTILNAVANNIYTISLDSIYDYCDLIVQAWQFIEGSQDLVSIVKYFNNANSNNFYYNEDNVAFDDDKCKIKDEYKIKSTLNDTNGFYESEMINKSEFIELYGMGWTIL